MKYSYSLLVIILTACWQPATGQTSRDQTEALAVYQQANGAATGQALRTALAQHSAGFLNSGTFQFGSLRTADGRSRPVAGLRYHPGLQVLEAQDSVDLETTHLWRPGSLRGFDLGEAGDPDVPLRRFRCRLVKEGGGAPRREFVEVITAIDGGPMLLAWFYTAASAPAASGHQPPVATLLAGPGTTGSDPLRPLEPTQAGVLRLFGARADNVRSFAATQQLDYTRPADIARMMDYYNRIAVVK